MCRILVDYQDGDKGLCSHREYLVLSSSPFSIMTNVEFIQCTTVNLNKFQEGTRKIILRDSSTKILSNLPTTLKTLVLENVPHLRILRGVPRECRIVKLGNNINHELEIVHG